MNSERIVTIIKIFTSGLIMEFTRNSAKLIAVVLEISDFPGAKYLKISSN